jgi:hypothetical protein
MYSIDPDVRLRYSIDPDVRLIFPATPARNIFQSSKVTSRETRMKSEKMSPFRATPSVSPSSDLWRDKLSQRSENNLEGSRHETQRKIPNSEQ